MFDEVKTALSGVTFGGNCPKLAVLPEARNPVAVHFESEQPGCFAQGSGSRQR